MTCCDVLGRGRYCVHQFMAPGKPVATWHQTDLSVAEGRLRKIGTLRDGSPVWVRDLYSRWWKAHPTKVPCPEGWTREWVLTEADPRAEVRP